MVVYWGMLVSWSVMVSWSSYYWSDYFSVGSVTGVGYFSVETVVVVSGVVDCTGDTIWLD